MLMAINTDARRSTITMCVKSSFMCFINALFYYDLASLKIKTIDDLYGDSGEKKRDRNIHYGKPSRGGLRYNRIIAIIVVHHNSRAVT